METLITPYGEFTIYPEDQRRRTYVNTYNDGGWIVGVSGDYLLCVLDRGSIQVVVTESELEW